MQIRCDEGVLTSTYNWHGQCWWKPSIVRSNSINCEKEILTKKSFLVSELAGP